MEMQIYFHLKLANKNNLNKRKNISPYKAASK